MHAVIDTSVAVAWYMQESFSPAARELHEGILNGSVHAMIPHLHYLEFANVLRTYIRRGEIDAQLAEELYRVHLDAPLELVEPPKSILLEVAIKYEATAYDAAFIALALTYECPLITAERTTTPWVVKLGKRAVTIG